MFHSNQEEADELLYSCQGTVTVSAVFGENIFKFKSTCSASNQETAKWG